MIFKFPIPEKQQEVDEFIKTSVPNQVWWNITEIVVFTEEDIPNG